jgi:hypothetical protein
MHLTDMKRWLILCVPCGSLTMAADRRRRPLTDQEREALAPHVARLEGLTTVAERRDLKEMLAATPGWHRAAIDEASKGKLS